MKLSFLRIHKSILSLPEIELPSFVVLTGVNGAGKSHLLESIEIGSIQVDDIVVVNNQIRPIRRFDWTNLVPQDTATAPSQLAQERHDLRKQIFVSAQVFRSHISQTLYLDQADLEKFGLTESDLVKLQPHEILDIGPEYLMERGSAPEQANIIPELIWGASEIATSNFTGNDPNKLRLVAHLEKESKKPFVALNNEEFDRYFPESWTQVDVFQQSFSRLFADYQRRWIANQLKALAHSKGEAVVFLTDAEFEDKYGEPPWDFVNDVLREAKLDFRINSPEKYEDSYYEPILKDQIRQSEIKFSDLSSGEKILMSFALCLYYAKDSRQVVDYPKVLLFDEIDAPLHPSMVQSLLSTIQEVLVKRHGIKVILTTHSPSTVALSPEESLYAMYKSDQKRIRKVTKDKALSILTSGIPTLSIDYENRRQVFVESHYDVKFYEALYGKLKEHLTPSVSLDFIASGGKKEEGCCAQVKDVVNKLSNAGSRTVYGIIDWDLTNFGNERIKVLGHGKRYSIENFIFDPVIVAAFLLREKWIERREIGLSDHETYVDFAKFDSARLQEIADFVVDKVKNHQSMMSVAETENLLCHYLGGQVIKVPKWFLYAQGHNLEEQLKATFLQLGIFKDELQKDGSASKKGNSKLKMSIIEKVLDDCPALIPQDFLSLFKEIQNI